MPRHHMIGKNIGKFGEKNCGETETRETRYREERPPKNGKTTRFSLGLEEQCAIGMCTQLILPIARTAWIMKWREEKSIGGRRKKRGNQIWPMALLPRLLTGDNSNLFPVEDGQLFYATSLPRPTSHKNYAPNSENSSSVVVPCATFLRSWSHEINCQRKIRWETG